MASSTYVLYFQELVTNNLNYIFIPTLGLIPTMLAGSAGLAAACMFRLQLTATATKSPTNCILS
jgi:hypothetical protein